MSRRDGRQARSCVGGWRIVAVLALAAAAAGCAVPELQREASYPPGWPDIASTADCTWITGTYLNKGILVDQAGQAQDVWLTSLLPYDRRMPPDAVRPERTALRHCERVSLRVEDWHWPDSPERKTSRLVVAPSRQAPAGSAVPWEPCDGFVLPEGRGWPLEDDVLAACAANFYVLMTNPGQIVYEQYGLQMVRGDDGSLIVKWSYGSQLGPDHVWVRFAPVQ